MSRPPVDPDLLLSRVASRQLGLVTREQAISAGLSRRVIGRRLAAGSWIALRRGVYRSSLTPATWHQCALATCIGRGGALAVSHEAAGYVHGLLPRVPARLDVVTPRSCSGAGLGGLARVHRVAIEELERRVVNGIPVTGLARTVADLAARLPAPAMTEVVDRAIFGCPTVAARARLLEGLAARAGVRRAGAPALRSACMAWRSDDRWRELASALEAEVLRLVLGAGLPEPVCQHRVALAGGGVALLDFAWPAAGVALEVDGFRFHADRTSFDADRRRGNALVAAGWQLLRTTAPQVRDRPQELLGALVEALGRAGASGGGARAGDAGTIKHRMGA